MHDSTDTDFAALKLADKATRAAAKLARADAHARGATAAARELALAMEYVDYIGGARYAFPPALLLKGALLAPGNTFVKFVLPDGAEVPFERLKLAEVAKVLRRRHDVTVHVDAAGLHVRWGAHGGLNLKPCGWIRRDEPATLVVAPPRLERVAPLPHAPANEVAA